MYNIYVYICFDFVISWRQAMISEILSRPGVRQMHFAQPAGQLRGLCLCFPGCHLAPYRAEILGLPMALLEASMWI